MPSPEAYSPSGRIPQRAHGRQRREAMIDAACAILAEAGEEGLTLHAVAQRASSSVGSMYHFFSDREQVLRAVAERHRAALTEITAANQDMAADRWRTMPAAELIRRLFQAPLAYLVAHPDALVVQHLHDAAPAEAFRTSLVEIMRARLGNRNGPKVAATLYAVSTGTLVHLSEMRRTKLKPDSVDIAEVLTAYLRHMEGAAPNGGE